MAEKKKERTVEPAIREYDRAKTIVKTIGDGLDPSGHAYEILWPVPESDEESQERYDGPLSFFIAAGVRSVGNAPDYMGLYDPETDEEGNPIKVKGRISYRGYGPGIDEDNIHAAMQDLADNYKIGQRTAGTSMKAKAKQHDEDQAKLASAGVSSVAELLEKAKALGLTIE